MLDIAICEDEAEAAKALEDHIKTFCEKNQIACSIHVYAQPIVFVTEYKANYDLIFMDIEMPHMNGIDVSRRIRDVDAEVPIIIVTNMKRMALKGYEVGAFDFLIKPVTYYGLELTLKKALKLIARKEPHLLTIPVKYGTRRVDAADVKYVEMVARKLVFHTQGEEIQSNGTLKDWEQSLYGFGFRRCNNYCVVNMRYITEVYKDEVRLGNESLEISRPRKKQFMQELTDYWGGTC